MLPRSFKSANRRRGVYARNGTKSGTSPTLSQRLTPWEGDSGTIRRTELIVQQTASVKHLALKVLREQKENSASARTCPTGVVQKIASGTGQNAGQAVGQVRLVQARVRGKDAVVESSQAETCWHCKGQKSCRCAFCAVPAPEMQWQPGECGACKGTGFLCWPERVQ